MTREQLIERILSAPFQGRRRLVALSGPPASGKSTFAAVLSNALANAAVVPMDGFHLDNRVLSARGDLSRKGAAHTFDAAGFVHLVRRIAVEETVVFPGFDRSLDASIAGYGVAGPDTQTVIFEGNYLLLDLPVWRDLLDLWDVSVSLTVPTAVLQERLVQRWVTHGYSPKDALAKAQQNDLLNAKFVHQHAKAAEFVIDAF